MFAIETSKEICAGGIVFASVGSYPCVLDALKSASIPAVLLNSYGACEFDTAHGEANVDAVVVFGGTNDFGHGDVPLGQFRDTENATFYGACHMLMKLLIE